MVTLRPAILPFFSRMVKVSRSACVGCSCAPSPALTTQALRKRERKWGAPVALWRMMMMSALRASRLRAVSLRVSPFLSEEASAEKLMTSAVRRWAASSKLMRVRVEGSMKRLTTVLPRRAGTFLMARSPTALKARAVSRTVTISAALRDSMSRRCLRCQAHRAALQVDGVLPLGFGKLHADVFRDGGGDIFADEIGLDGKFSMAAVNEHGELDAARTAKIVEGVQRGADGPPAEEHVVHKHHGLSGDIEGDDRRMNVLAEALGEVIAVHGDIHAAVEGTGFGTRCRRGARPRRLGQRMDPAAMDAHQRRRRRSFHRVRRFRGRCGSKRALQSGGVENEAWVQA